MSEPYDRFWAEYLGVKPSDWGVPGVSVNAHVGLAGYCGVWFFRRRDRLAVSAPAGWVPHLEQSLANASQVSPDQGRIARCPMGLARHRDPQRSTS